ncbi:MAG: Flp pilus assembly complex ATPase component TadA [Candidatus Omnitrophica bacterium]|nr:Flp pilus assembly complex ATPase component TadA [Candidatus Omnitrophota bacterium]
MRYKKIGEILLLEGLISSPQLEEAIKIQRKDGGRLGEALIKLGYVTDEQIVVALGKQLGIPYVTLSSGKLKPSSDQDLQDLLPYDFALKNICIPLSRTISSLTVAMFDPTDLILLDNLRKMTSCDINPIIAPRADILKTIEEFYGKAKIFQEAIEETYADEPAKVEEIKESAGELSLDRLIARAEEAPVVKLVDLIVRQAIHEGASDIHLEPQRDRLILRYRIDGVLYEMPPPSPSLHLALVSRIKILSRMDIAEKRLPQDGGFTVKTDTKVIDLRISSIPTIYGEKIVIRILDKSRVPLDLAQIGFLPQELEVAKKGVTAPHGLVLLTGPTGSGKTTTLYATLNYLKTPKKNIITTEDPVEYRLDGINQVQVRPEIGLSFAQALRSFLRQDPDIILVGEVRDLETAEICMRAALTGHLVLSTLHTNDAVSAIVRLVDIGIPNYLVASSLRLIIAQRLIRKLCPSCKQAYEPKTKEFGGIKMSSGVIYKPKGCQLCNFIGYKGRSLIAEVILVDEEIRELIYNKASLADISKLARKKGFFSLLASGLKKVEDGTTSLDEVLSIVIV